MAVRKSILRCMRQKDSAQDQSTVLPEVRKGDRLEVLKLREDCFFYCEDIDMGAYVPNCGKAKYYGECPCSENCENYISRKEVRNLVEKELKRRKDEH